MCIFITLHSRFHIFEKCTFKTCLLGTQKHLKADYGSRLSRLEPIPGEKFSVSLDDSKLMMTAKFESWEIDLESKKNKDMIRYNRPLDTDKAVYKCLNISELGDVFNSVGDLEMNVNNLQGKLITLIGDPGVGKTTAAQRLAWDWASGKGYISQRFTLVFFLCVKEVRHKSLMDVLLNLKLLPESDEIKHLDDISKDCLFILDGADENDLTGDLYRLITGELYPDSTVLLTARPEAKCLKSFPVLPRVKVTLLGTDTDTVHRYMREAVSLSSDEEWKSFQDNYQEKMPDTSLLNIPLYLCTLCALFKDHIANGLKCANLKIPESSTELFNAFLHVIISRWLARTNRNENINFEKSPLDPNSTIPGDIKALLYFIGKLCYKDLTKTTSNYQFTDTEARKYFLDMQVIKDCGLFNVGKSEKHEIFYLKHKQLQEYLAALYLSHEGTKEQSFHELLYSEKNKGLTLFDVMRNINAVRLLQFTCGLSGEFLKSLLNIATSQFCLCVSPGIYIKKTPSCNTADIYYESVLFTEHHPGDLSAVTPDDLHGFTELKKYLVNTEICLIDKRARVPIPVFNMKCLRTLCGLFDKTLSLQLLSRFYGINVKPVGGGESVNYEIEGHTGSKIELRLDQLQTELLNVVCVHSVHSVRSFGENVFVDIPALLQTFPHLSELTIRGHPYTPYCSTLRSDRHTGTSLTRVTLWGDIRDVTLHESHVHTLLLQTNLSHLKLDNKHILPVLTRTTQSVWSHLQYLTLEDSCESDDEVRGMCRVLQSSRHTLTVCDLRIDVVVNTLPLIEQTLTSLTRVEVLTLVLSVHEEPYNPCDTLQRILPHLTTLHTLGVHYAAVCNTPDRFVDTVCVHTNIRTLRLQGMYSREFPQQCKDKLTQCGVKVEA